MKLMLFEPAYQGHFFQYAARIARSALDLGVETTLVTSVEAEKSRELSEHFGPLAARLTIQAPLSVESNRAAAAYWAAICLKFIAAVKEHKPDHIIIPFADGLTPMLTILCKLGAGRALRGREIEAIFLRTSFLYRNRDTRSVITELLYRASPVKTMRFLDGVTCERLKLRPWSRNRSIMVIPDFSDTLPSIPKSAARAALGLEQTGEWIVCAGVMHPRKGILQLLRAFVELEPRRPEMRLLIAGEFYPGMAEQVSRISGDLAARGKLVLKNQFLNAEDLNAALCAAELVAAAYPGRLGTSGIVSRAVGHDRPVLTQYQGWCGQIVPRLKLGTVLDPADAATYPSKLAAGLDMARTWTPSPAAERLKQFWRPENFDRLCISRMRQRLGLPVVPACHWDDVVG